MYKAISGDRDRFFMPYFCGVSSRKSIDLVEKSSFLIIFSTILYGLSHFFCIFEAENLK